MKYTKEELENEKWKPINGYEGLYEVSNLGRVKTLYGSRKAKCGILKEFVDYQGYIISVLYKNKKGIRYKNHRLVCQNWIPNPENKPTVNHIDGDKQNNRLSNLEWATQAENNLHAKITGLWNAPEVPKGKDNDLSKEINCYNIYGEYMFSTWGSREMSEKLKLREGSDSVIRAACRGKYNAYLDYMFRYQSNIGHKNNIAPNPKTVAMFTMDMKFLKRYKTSGHAGEDNNIILTAIGNNLSKRTNSSGGYKWFYLIEFWDEEKRTIQL